MEPRVQYTRTKDGLSIAYWSLGEGQPLVIMPAMPMSHIEYEWQIPEWRAFYERLAERRRLIRYDGRGTGMFDRKATQCSLETWQLDLDAVVDRLGLESFALFAAYLPGPAAIHYAVNNPYRVSNLVLWCSFAAASELSSPVVQAIAEGNDLYGAAVIMASRCAGQARGGEILATDVVRQLVMGRDVQLRDRGLFDLRGFEDPVRLYEVPWEDR